VKRIGVNERGTVAHDGGVAFPLRNAGGEPAARMT